MKLLLFSDLHTDTSAVARLVDLSRGADVVVGAGDFASARRGISTCIHVLQHISIPAVLVPGNNESYEELVAACVSWKSARVRRQAQRAGALAFADWRVLGRRACLRAQVKAGSALRSAPAPQSCNSFAAPQLLPCNADPHGWRRGLLSGAVPQLSALTPLPLTRLSCARAPMPANSALAMVKDLPVSFCVVFTKCDNRPWLEARGRVGFHATARAQRQLGGHRVFLECRG